MKTIKNLFLSLAIIAGLGLQSCSSDDDSSSTPNTFISFTIDGTDYNFTDIATAESAVITLNGNNGTGGLTDVGDTQISIWMPIGVEPGTYDIENSFTADYQVSFSSEPLDFDFDFADSGSVTFTQTTGEFIEGTFNAMVTNNDGTTITIENGEFRGVTID